jgi:hypothetical protein
VKTAVQERMDAAIGEARKRRDKKLYEANRAYDAALGEIIQTRVEARKQADKDWNEERNEIIRHYAKEEAAA